MQENKTTSGGVLMSGEHQLELMEMVEFFCVLNDYAGKYLISRTFYSIYEGITGITMRRVKTPFSGSKEHRPRWCWAMARMLRQP